MLVCFEVTGKAGHAYRFMAAYVATLFTTVVTLALIPRESAAALLLPPMVANAPTSGWLHVPIIEKLRAGTFGPVDVEHLNGLIAFPSFHAASAILFAFAAWPVRWLRFPGLIINALMLAAMPIHGGYYFIDTVAGVCLALVAVALTRSPRPQSG